MADYELRWVRRAVTDDPFRTGRALLTSLVAELTGADPSVVRISATCPDCGGPHGRPTVANSPVSVSLAHTPTLTVAVARVGGPIGVDAEDLPATADAEAAVGALTGRASIHHWTRVEAVVKADGRGLRLDPGDVDVVESNGRTEASIAGSLRRFVIVHPEIDTGVTVAVALESGTGGTDGVPSTNGTGNTGSTG